MVTPDGTPRGEDDPTLDALALMIRAELHAANLGHADVISQDHCTPCTRRAHTAAAAVLPDFLARGAEIDRLRAQVVEYQTFLDRLREDLATLQACDMGFTPPEIHEAADPARGPSLSWLSGWESAMREVDTWAQRQVESAEEHGDDAGGKAYSWCSTFAVTARNDPTAPGRLADRTSVQPSPDARLWQEGDLEPPVGTAVVDVDGDRWIKEDRGWVCLGDPSLDAEDWETLVREWGPLTEVVETEPKTRTLTVTWHPDAIRRAVAGAKAIMDTLDPEGPPAVIGELRLTWMDLACLVDAGRQFLTEEPGTGDVQ